MKATVAVLVLTFVASAAWARELAGVVRDTMGARIAGAEVVVQSGSTAQKKVTDNQGRFSFTSIAPPATMRVSAAGFETFERELADAGVYEVTLQPATVAEKVAVSATRVQVPLSQLPADLRVLSFSDVQSSGGLLLDDVLRQAVGFSLFRRSDSRVANPTSQGVSLRGVGTSGVSRAAVLRDGIPMTDPFGGWVYWDRIPRLALQSVEIMRGGASDLYGANALSGVVNLVPRHAADNVLDLELSGGSSLQPDVSAFAGTKIGSWTVDGSVESVRSPGYFTVSGADRGAVDAPASLDFTTSDVTVARAIGQHARTFAEGMLFSESRGNGTVLQTNSTNLGQMTTGIDASFGALGNFSVRLYATGERYHQSFSAIALDRSAEMLTRTQVVPSTGAGASLQWDRAVGSSHHLIAGFEWRHVRGTTEETAFASGAPSVLIAAGGRMDSFGWYAGDFVRLASRLTISGTIRGDLWHNRNGFSDAQPLNGGTPSAKRFADRSESAISPRVAVRLAASRHLAVIAAAYRSFRAPTLNELYRGFRLGNILTLANPSLTAERLTGGEGGLELRGSHAILRSTLFWAQVNGPISNATVSASPALITRQRQNLGATRARGIEVEAEVQPASKLFFGAGYQWIQSIVLVNPAAPDLVGLLVPQVPPHQFTASVRYQGSSWTFAVQARGSGRQFEDDQNQLPLDAYASVDAFVSRRISGQVEAFAAIENVLDQRYMVGRTPVPTWGPPLLARGGIRIHLEAR